MGIICTKHRENVDMRVASRNPPKPVMYLTTHPQSKIRWKSFHRGRRNGMMKRKRACRVVEGGAVD